MQGYGFQYWIKVLEPEKVLEVFTQWKHYSPVLALRAKFSWTLWWRTADLHGTTTQQPGQIVKLGQKTSYLVCMCRKAAKLIQSFLLLQLLCLRLLVFRYLHLAVMLPQSLIMTGHCLCNSMLCVCCWSVNLDLLEMWRQAMKAELFSYQCLSSFVPTEGLCLKSVTAYPLPCLFVINVWKQNPA